MPRHPITLKNRLYPTDTRDWVVLTHSAIRRSIYLLQTHGLQRRADGSRTAFPDCGQHKISLCSPRLTGKGTVLSSHLPIANPGVLLERQPGGGRTWNFGIGNMLSACT